MKHTGTMVFVLNGALLFGASAQRALGQRVTPDTPPPGGAVTTTLPREATSVFSAFAGVPATQPLTIEGKFHVPIGLKILLVGDKVKGTTKYQTTDGQRMILVVRATVRVGPGSASRDAVLTIRPSADDPQKLTFAGRVLENVPQSMIDEISRMPSLDRQIDRILTLKSEDLPTIPKKPEATLMVDSMSRDKSRLYRVKENGDRGEMVTMEVAPRPDGQRALSISVKGYEVSVILPR